MFRKQIWLLLLSVTTAAAQTAIITIEASHGGAGSGLTNTTIEVPLNTRYQSPALNTVSTLYLTGAEGVSWDSITCTPYRNGNLTGSGGLPFTSSTPSLLSTNTVRVGSLFCNSTANSSKDTSSSSTRPTTTSSSSARNATSVLLTTVGPPSPTAGPSTVTSFATVDGQEGPPMTSTYTSVVDVQASQTSTASPSLNSEGGATKTQIGDWLAREVALAGVGLAMIL